MAKAAFWTMTDVEARKRGEQTGLDTPVSYTHLLDQIDDLRIVQTGVQKLYPIFNGSPVEVDHKFQK